MEFLSPAYSSGLEGAFSFLYYRQFQDTALLRQQQFSRKYILVFLIGPVPQA